MRFNPYLHAAAPDAPPGPETITAALAATAPDSPIAITPPPVPVEGPRAADAFLAAYGRPGADPIIVPAGQMAVTLCLKHNDSAAQVDHWDHHASLGCPDFALLVTRQTSRTEGLARQALALAPSLHRLDWKWHTENYAGGHGNYLQSSAYRLPDPIRQAVARHTRKTFSGAEIDWAFWEIEFARPYRDQVLRLPPHAQYGVAPVGDTPFTRTDAGPRGPIVATVAHNQRHNGVEIHFSRRPDDAALAPLRANRAWRYSGAQRCWYARYSVETWDWANEFIKHLGQP